MAAKPQVLFVDDEPVTAKLYARAIHSRGIGCVIAEGGEEGLRLAKEIEPRVIVSDVQMPGMDGFEFCQELVERGLKNVPVIFFTGHDNIDILTYGLHAGGDDFLIKGSSLTEILQRVTFWMATGFRSLPYIARSKAIKLLYQELETAVPAVSDVIRVDSVLLKKLTDQAVAETAMVSDQYGERMVERIFFLGRLSHLVLEQCQTLGTVVRFPDYLMGAIAQLNYDWLPELEVLMHYFDYFSSDPRFKEAAEKGLIEVT